MAAKKTILPTPITVTVETNPPANLLEFDKLSNLIASLAEAEGVKLSDVDVSYRVGETLHTVSFTWLV